MISPKLYLLTSIALLFVLGTASAAENAANDPKQLGQKFEKRIRAWHADQPKTTHKLRVVYFHGSDTEPQADFQERIGRIMDDIADFYLDGMRQNGFTPPSLPLEKENGKLKIHAVKGRGKSNGYDYDIRHGVRIRRELVAKLKGVIDFEREFVLVFGGLCEKRDDGSYRFHSPYYGMGGASQKNGLCFAADCEMLDTRHFKTTDKKFRYEEHNGKFTRTLAAFNSLYIGGIAHELGHGLALPHNGQKSWEKKKQGTALMGSGNFTYRRELVGQGGSFMTMASAVRLASHPLFTTSDRERFAKASIQLQNISFRRDGENIIVSGSVTGTPEPFAVTVYTDPEGGGGYDAHTWVSEVVDGKFEVAIRQFRNGPHELRLAFNHLNGAVSTERHSHPAINPKAVSELKGAWGIQLVEAAYMDGDKPRAAKIAKQQLANTAKGSEQQSRLRHLLELTDDSAPVSLDSIKGDSAWLSDVTWDSAKVGWGKLVRNQYDSNQANRNGVSLMLGGEFHAKGLSAHAPASHEYALDGKWKRFTATVGLQAGVADRGSAIFSVKGDGKTLYRGKLLKGTNVEKIDISVAGVKKLKLLVTSGKQGNANCWSAWGSPKLDR